MESEVIKENNIIETVRNVLNEALNLDTRFEQNMFGFGEGVLKHELSAEVLD